MSDLVTSNYTFLFAAVDDSGQLWEQYPDAMQVAQAQYESAIQDVVREQKGEIFQIAGDSYFIAFPTAAVALVAALAMLRYFTMTAWPVPLGNLHLRLALHSGPVELRNGNYVASPTFNRLARILAAAHPGQIVISAAVVQLASERLPSDATLRDFGIRRLRDLAEPLHLYQLTAADLPQDFPPLKTLDRRPNNLPGAASSFVGREADIAALAALLRQPNVQLVTLSGPGGSGKTRLSLEVAADLLDEYEHGVYFIPLAAVIDPNLVASTIAHSLAVDEQGSDLTAILSQYLADKQMLLVLDNFEQIVAAAPFVGAMLAAAPRLKVLVSSRELLHIPAEHEYPVLPLDLPNLEQLPSLAQLQELPVIKLFVQRAQAVNYNFVLTEGNAAAVAEICTRLDGLPLAIELAAARSKQLDPTRILAQLDHRLNLLVSEYRNLTPRQRSLRGAIEWSYDLLEPQERLLFQRLAIFTGGCDVAAATAVCSGSEIAPEEVSHLLAQLADKSLVQAETQGAAMRYLMLETIREYALLVIAEVQTTRYTMQQAVREYASEQLTAAGEETDLRQRHADYYLKLVEEGEPKLMGAEQVTWLNHLEMEKDNIRAALTWLHTQNQSEDLMRMANSMWHFWYTRGYYSEGRGWLEAGLLMSEGEVSKVRAKALNSALALADEQGDYEAAIAFGKEALAIARQLDDQPRIAATLNSLAIVTMPHNNTTAEAYLRDAMAIEQQLGNRHRVSTIANNLGIALSAQGKFVEASQAHQQSLTIAREVDDKWGVANVLNNLADTSIEAHNLSLAEEYLSESQQLCEELGNKYGMTMTVMYRGRIAEQRGDFATAQANYQHSLELWRELGAETQSIGNLTLIANLARKQADYATAIDYFKQGLLLSAKHNYYAIPELLVAVAVLIAAEGKHHAAARLLGAVANRLAITARQARPLKQAEVNQLSSRLIEQMGEAEFSAAYAEGETMSGEQAYHYALNLLETNQRGEE